MPIEIEEEKDRTGFSGQQKDSGRGKKENPFSIGMPFDEGIFNSKDKIRLIRSVNPYSRRGRRGRSRRPVLVSRISALED